MRIDLSTIDRDQFILAEHTIVGETCTLVTPQHIGTKWTEDNLHLRSSLWDSQGELISASWRKHFNWPEQPDIHPAPKDLDTMTLVEKIDGSTLLISRYRGQLIIRTRGTVDATKMANGHEIEVFKTRYPKLFEDASDRYTLVAEWVSPENVIVIQYPEADLYLTGVIWHSHYDYTEQNHLDKIAKELGVKRPRTYSFASVEDMLREVEGFKGVEGICAYYPLDGIRDNCYRKNKGAVYLSLHRFKERVSVDSLLDLWFAQDRPDLMAFQANLARDFDFECAGLALPIGTRICEAHLNVLAALRATEQKVKPLRALPRRDAALAIQAQIPKLYQSVAFNMLSDKPVDPKQVRRLMEAELETPVEEPAP